MNITHPKKPSTTVLPRTLGPVADLERHLPNDWWKTLFTALYLKTDGDVVENDQNTVKEIDLLVDITQLKPEHKILDLCCGQGRHSLELGKRGFKNVFGVDRSRYLIRTARKRNKQLNLNINFSEGDARKIRFPDSFLDCVALFGNSFGYFEHQEDDYEVLRSIKRVLKSGGRLIMDVVDGAWMRSHFEPRSWEWIDQYHFVCRERSLSTNKSRIISREVVVHAEKGVIADQFYAERLYSFDELNALLSEIGFRDIIPHASLTSASTREQDLGMMAHRIFLSAIAPKKKPVKIEPLETKNEILVLFGDPKLPDSVKRNGTFNNEDLETVQVLKNNLRKLKNYKVSYHNNHRSLITQLMQNPPPQLIFNLCDEGFNNDPKKELHVPALLEMLNIPYTGAPPPCLAMCYNKAIVRALASSLDIEVPLETYFDPSDHAASIPHIFPAILKPNYGDSSVGITQKAVVYNSGELVAYLEELRTNLPNTPILIQEYLTGSEYSVGLIGNPGHFTVLPILEVDYSDLPPQLPKILGYESKWLPNSAYWTNIKYVPAVLDNDTERQLIDSSMILFERLGCRDYARIDFRADESGKIKLLEVNPNPGWCWDGKMNLMAGFEGKEYHDLLQLIIQAALERIKGYAS